MVTVIVVATLAMIIQDCFGVLMVQAENRGWGWRSGFMDAGMYLCALATNHYALNALNSSNKTLQVLVVGFVTIANVIGSKLGQEIGDRFFPDPNRAALENLISWAMAQGYQRPVK